jgi:hypothetical protein
MPLADQPRRVEGRRGAAAEGAIGDHGKTLSTDKNGKPDSNGDFDKPTSQKGSFEVDATALNTRTSKQARRQWKPIPRAVGTHLSKYRPGRRAMAPTAARLMPDQHGLQRCATRRDDAAETGPHRRPTRAGGRKAVARFAKYDECRIAPGVSGRDRAAE